jgi:AAA family ATP:ADP antiporter
MALPRPLRALWGDLTPDEVGKFSILSATLFTLIGSYWLLRSMKDAILTLLVGIQYQPIAKMISPFVIILAVIFYNKLINLLKRTTLFYTITTFFGVSFLGIAYLLSQPELFITSPTSLIGRYIPGNVLGWLIYFSIECFGSIVVALFWSFVASVMTAESAKRGYGMISAMAQIGQILGAGLVAFAVHLIGQPKLFALGGIAICTLPLFIRAYAKAYPDELKQVTTLLLLNYKKKLHNYKKKLLKVKPNSTFAWRIV